MASYQDIESWFQKEEKENQVLVELTKDIKEILSKRGDQGDSKSVRAAEELTEEGEEDKQTMEQLTQQLDGIVEEMKSQMTEVDVKLRDDGGRPNFQDPFHLRGKEAETKPMEQRWKKARQERMDLSSPVSVVDEKSSPSSGAEERPKEVTASVHPVPVVEKQSEDGMEPGKQGEEEAEQTLPPAGFQLPSWLTCNKN